VPIIDPVLSQINPAVTSHPGHKTAFIPNKYGVVQTCRCLQILIPRRKLIIPGINRYHLSCCHQLGVQIVNCACPFLAVNQPFVGAETYLIDEF
jgi:hypothetical protein